LSSTLGESAGIKSCKKEAHTLVNNAGCLCDAYESLTAKKKKFSVNIEALELPSHALAPKCAQGRPHRERGSVAASPAT
jgi:hypothetical protein